MQEEEPPVGNYGDNHARVMREWEIRSHIGKILTILETLNLPERQERAVKNLIKASTWSELWNGGTTVIYSKEADKLLYDAIEKEIELQSKPRDGKQPVPEV